METTVDRKLNQVVTTHGVHHAWRSDWCDAFTDHLNNKWATGYNYQYEPFRYVDCAPYRFVVYDDTGRKS